MYPKTEAFKAREATRTSYWDSHEFIYHDWKGNEHKFPPGTVFNDELTLSMRRGQSPNGYHLRWHRQRVWCSKDESTYNKIMAQLERQAEQFTIPVLEERYFKDHDGIDLIWHIDQMDPP